MYFSKMHAMLPQDEASSTYTTPDWSLCVVKWGREERTFRGLPTIGTVIGFQPAVWRVDPLLAVFAANGSIYVS
jgi:hypothetical protein